MPARLAPSCIVHADRSHGDLTPSSGAVTCLCDWGRRSSVAGIRKRQAFLYVHAADAIWTPHVVPYFVETRMVRLNVFAVLVLAAVAGIFGSAQSWAQDSTDLTGRWTLNREQSQFPREIGFNPDWASPRSGGSDTSTGGGRGRRGSGGGTPGAFPASRETPDDSQRMSQLTDEVRAPAARLTIVDTPSAVTITDDRERSRTFHPSGKEELLQLDGVPVAVTARRESGRLVILYKVEQGRELRYSFSRTGSPRQLVVDVQFAGRGGGDKVQRVYEPGSATESPAAPAAPLAAPAPTITPPDLLSGSNLQRAARR